MMRLRAMMGLTISTRWSASRRATLSRIADERAVLNLHQVIRIDHVDAERRRASLPELLRRTHTVA